jgi:PPM family protein phosphatase
MNWRNAQLEVGARSETGYVRDENQDRMSGTRVPLGFLYIVADGMGGHKGGALAAELTVQGLQRYIGEAPVNTSVEKVIHAAFNEANQIVYQQGHAGDPATEGMGSTAVLLLISGRVARVAHVGDSRAYLYRRGRLKQLTTDHTVVQKMVQAGMLKPEEAADHPNASILDRAIGSKAGVTVDISNALRLHEGDAILLCSDGLSGYVADSEIASVLRSRATVQDIPERLVELALKKGGEDNVTVQLIQYGTRKQTWLLAPILHYPVFQIAAVLIVGLILGAISIAIYYASIQHSTDGPTPVLEDHNEKVPQLQNHPGSNLEGRDQQSSDVQERPLEKPVTEERERKMPDQSSKDDGKNGIVTSQQIAQNTAIKVEKKRLAKNAKGRERK